jgi:outer membrane biosynthesis protein TonB
VRFKDNSISRAKSASTQQNNDAKEMMTSNDADAPTIAPVKTDNNSTHHNRESNIAHQNKKSTVASKDNHTHQQQERPKYVYHGSNGPGGNSAITNAAGGNEGNTSGEGDRGVVGGTRGASNYVGSPGNGTGGISHTLSGRDISPKQFVAEFHEGGKVVIKVTVDRAGNIVNKTVKSSPSVTLSNLALQKLSQAKFTANNDAAPQQFGEITIVFKTHGK